MRRFLIPVLLLSLLAAAWVVDAEARSNKNPNEIVYVLSLRPNLFHHHSCRRARHRDAFAVRRWWAEDRGAREHGCFP